MNKYTAFINLLSLCYQAYTSYSETIYGYMDALQQSEMPQCLFIWCSVYHCIIVLQVTFPCRQNLLEVGN